MQRKILKHSFWLTLCVVGTVAVSGCKKDEEEVPVVEEEQPINIVGPFLQGGYDPAKAQATVYETSISGSARSTSSNLFRWDKRRENRVLGTRRDYLLNNGRLYLRAARDIWGAVEPSGNVFFMTEPGVGLSLSVRQPEEEAVHVTSDLEGNFTCVRALAPVSKIVGAEEEIIRPPSPARIQLLSADFYPGSATVSYRVLRSSDPNDIETTGEETYAFDADDGSLRFSPVGGSGAVVMDEPPVELKQENVRVGGFNRQHQALFVAYATADQQPSREEVLSEDFDKDKSKNAEAVSSSAYLMCLKGGQSVSSSTINGEYWFGSTDMSRVAIDAQPLYKPTFGRIVADGVGRLDRIECKSSEVTRSFPMSYVVSNAGEMTLTSTDVDKHGVVSADGSVAMFMHSSVDGLDIGYEIWMKKRQPSECPAP